MYKPIDQALCSELISLAKESHRQRSHRCFHANHSEAVQRVFIGLIAGTYVQPYKHPTAQVGDFYSIQDSNGHVI